MPTKSEIEDYAEKLRASALELRKPVPPEVTPRMAAYLRAYFERFGAEFSLGQLMDVEKLPSAIMRTYKVESGKYADVSILSSMLVDTKLIEAIDGHRSFRVTARGRILAETLANKSSISGAEAL